MSIIQKHLINAVETTVKNYLGRRTFLTQDGSTITTWTPKNTTAARPGSLTKTPI